MIHAIAKAFHVAPGLVEDSQQGPLLYHKARQARCQPGLEEDSSPVYRQAHSKEVRKVRGEEKILAEEYLLYRCDGL